MLSHTTLSIYYENTFALVQHHKYTIQDIDALIPFERYIYIEMLVDYIKRQKEEMKKNGKNR